MSWLRLGARAPTALRGARVQLHWAAQVLSATADAWIDRTTDDSHTNMTWSDDDGGALLGNPTAHGLRLALRVSRFELAVIVDGAETNRLPLAGRTLADAMAFADSAAASAAGESTRFVHARDYDMPDHPVRSVGAPFDADPDALAELARWYGNADALLRSIEAAEPGSTSIRCWPHHFDIGGIVFLTPAGFSGPQIGFGLSPGDHYYEEPYFYLTAWPRRPDATYPDVAGGGFWRHGDFTGAVLVGSTVVAAGGAEEQEAAARAYFESAFAGARSGVIAL